jgi:hypothetical protein
MLVRGEAADEGHIGAVAEGRLEALQVDLKRLLGLLAEKDAEKALVPGDEVVPGQETFPLSRPALAEAEETAQACIGGPIGRIDEERRPVGQIEPAADDEADAGLLGGLVGALRSTTPSAGRPRSFACSKSSRGLDAPRRNEKWVVTWSSA